MKFGIFYEHQLPKPWTEGLEQQLFQDALDQVELADKLGIDYAWEVEHHFLEEDSHSSLVVLIFLLNQNVSSTSKRLSKSATCWQWILIRGLTASTSVCRAETLSLNPPKGPIHLSGLPAQTGKLSKWLRGWE